MKNNIIFVLLVSFLSLQSCGDNFLEQQNYKEKDLNSFYKNNKDISEALNGAYSCLAPYDWYGQYTLISNILSDDCFSGGIIGDFLSLDADMYQSTREDEYLIMYQRCYQGIFYVNNILEKINDAVYDSTPVRDKILFIKSW